MWGCPLALSDEFIVLDGAPDLSAGGGAGEQGGTEPPDPLHASGTGGAGGTPVTIRVAPSVVSVSPSNDASGVAVDAVVTLTFSEPMNTGTVEAAYGSSDLPVGSVSFSWSEDDTVLQIVPNQPLTRATGSSLTTVARRYAFEIGTAAVDLGGDALPRFSSSFTTLREISQTLGALQDRTLTGNWRSDDVYGDNSCQFDDSTTTCIGDSSNANAAYRGFVTFDLSDLPAQIQQLSSAQLGMSVDDIRGSPFTDLGNLVAEHVSFDSISLDAFEAAALGSVINVSSSATPGTQLSVDVLSPVQDDLLERDRSQFRFRFSSATNSDDEGDLLQMVWTTEQLAVTYLIP